MWSDSDPGIARATTSGYAPSTYCTGKAESTVYGTCTTVSI